ncbi:hypothetical protein [Streptomyces sp. NPDC086182]|jgi:hypothetical protein|uniref:hypothetical protein n=1 Tax=Streptomyces sp. NPDC086182 TaxID=3155058 RepID=UPI003427A18D
MDRFALCRALEAAGVPAASYEIAGCPGGLRAAERYFLEGHDGDWTVGVHERGTHEVFERFADEGEACRWLYDRLIAESSAPAPATEAPADPGGDSEALQRQADEELEQALAEMRRRARERSGEKPREVPHDGPAERDGPA